MCGIAGIVGPGARRGRVQAMVAAQRHRGPDGVGLLSPASGAVVLGHSRLRILDLSDAGRQPFSSVDGRYHIVLNGEVYNYRELRDELGPEPYRSATDTEVVLRAFERWGPACLDRFLGMFAFAVWDDRDRTLFAARDRFGVKPFHYATETEDGEQTLLFASEPKALHAAGLPARPDEVAWATWLAYGLQEQGPRTFSSGVSSLPAGHTLTWCDGRLSLSRWYDLAARVSGEDDRPVSDVIDEYRGLLEHSVRLRFRSDVPVGINLSGGLDSSILLGLVQAVEGPASAVEAFTFVTGDPRYDETPWVSSILERTRHPSVLCRLSPEEVPVLAGAAHRAADGPTGGLPMLAYARLFETAAAHGVKVLLDGQGMDEQWGGYDYYVGAHGVRPSASSSPSASLVQGTHDFPLRPDCLDPAFRALAEPPPPPPASTDALRALQLRDLLTTKIPRALRYNDRISMRSSCELREPFLDHRLVELALRQPADRKIANGERKVLLRRLASALLPADLRAAAKRPVQTPQREWLRGPLKDWASDCVREGTVAHRDWLLPSPVAAELEVFLAGGGDTSFFVWQWIDVGLMSVR